MRIAFWEQSIGALVFFWVSRLIPPACRGSDNKKILSCSVSRPITRKFSKSDQKKNTLSTRGMSKMEFLADFWPRSTGIFSHFSWYFWHFSCFYVVLARLSLVFWHAQFIVCTIWTYKRALCMTHMYIATKRAVALISSVQCVCRAFLSCPVVPKRGPLKF